MTFGYGQFTLPAPWGEWIETGWWFASAPRAADNPPPVPPSTGASIVLVCRGADVPWAVLRGPHRVTRFAAFEPGMTIVGLRLWPDALSSLLGARMSDWFDRVGPLESVVGLEPATDLRSRVATAMATDAPLAALSGATAEWLSRLDREGHPTIDPCVRSALLLINASAGTLSVGAIADRLTVSRRTLERRTREATDTTIKWLLREARMKAAVRAMHATPHARAAAIAADYGFVDQSHLTHEVAAMLGTSTQRLRDYLADVSPPVAADPAR